MWFDEKIGQELLDKKGPPKRVELVIKATNYCPNLCDFCCMDSNLEGKHLDLEKTKLFIEDIEKNGAEILEVQLTGGEALFNDGSVDFLRWLKGKRYRTALLTSGVNPKKEFSKIYNKRMKECINDYLLDELSITYGSGVEPKKRIKNLDKLLNKTKAFSKLKVHIGRVTKEYDLVEDFSFLKDREKYYGLGINTVRYSGRGKKELPVNNEHDDCELIDSIDSLDSRKFPITVLEHGEIYPCCCVEPVIKGIKPLGNISGGYVETVKKMYCYQELLKRFFVQSKNQNCALCANEFENFLESAAAGTFSPKL